jgi:tetratricopeptide (TPR) repeat protein
VTEASGESRTWRNDLSGTVTGSTVQAQTIHGDVHFHAERTAPSPVPHQLLVPASNFAGRVEHLEALDQLLGAAGPKLVVLSGAGGVGKTALATRWAHSVVDRFFDGQLYFDLSAFGVSGPADPAEALASFLRALGVPAGGVPTALSEQAALYRSVTSNRSLLVMLDDAYSAAQVRVLLPASPSSLVVVISRRRLSGLVPDGAHLIEVGPLPVEDAVALLTNAVGQERVAREWQSTIALADICGGLPIALSVAAARLASRPALSVGRVAAELASESGRLRALAVLDDASVQATFDMSYRSLDPLTATLYRRLAFHPGRDFGAGIVAALRPASEAVERLLDANLVQETDEDRFRFHVLLRLHARQKAEAQEPPGELAAARLAMLEWYFAAASAADVTLTPYRRRLAYQCAAPVAQVPTFDGRAEALAWLERERANLIAATGTALELGHLELSWHLAYTLWPLFLYGKHYRDRLEVDQVGVTAARAWGNKWAEAVMLKRLGRVCANTGDFAAAVRYTDAAIRLYDTIGDRQGQVDAVEGLAGIHRDAGDNDSAASLYGEVLTTRRGLDDHRATALTLVNLGTVLTCRGWPDEALRLLGEAQETLAALSQLDPYNEARAAIALSDAHLGRGDLLSAERIAAQAAVQMRELGSDFEFAEALDVLGRVARRRGDIGLARRHFEQASRIFQAAGSRRAEQLRQRLTQLAAAS